MTVNQIVANLGIDVTTLTARQQALISSWGNTDIRLKRIRLSDGTTIKDYQLADFTLSELRRILTELCDGKSPPSIIHAFEGV